MRFTCPKCGKKYASSAEPAPGKAYRLKCKACGETIVLRAGGVVSTSPTPPPGANASVAPSPRPRPAPPRARAAVDLPASPSPTPTPEPTPSSAETQPVASRLELPVPPVTPTSAVAPPPPPGPAPEPVSPRASAPVAPAPAPPAAAASSAPAPPPPGDAALALDGLLDDAEPSTGKPLSPDDPFAAAARASLPDGYGAEAGGAAPDPIAALTREPGAPTPAPGGPRREATPPSFAAIAKPDRPRVNPILVLLAAGVLVLVAVLAIALVRGGGPRRAPTGAKPPAAEQPVAR